MVILFVCMGNAYRSRLAEAFMKSLNLPGVTVISAGVQAGRIPNVPISPYAQQLIDEYHLGRYGKPSWTRLDQAMLDGADVVVCMNRQVYAAAREAGYQFPLRTFIWGIADVDQLIPDFAHHQDKVPHIAHRTFNEITAKVQELALYLRRPKPAEPIDVFLPDGSSAGRRADIDTIHVQGLWHQGVHAAVIARTGGALFEKRSSSIIGSPGLWDFTLGGLVSAGEQPHEALARELHEELGISITPDQMSKLFLYRSNHFLPHYGLHSRVFVHTYLVRLEHHTDLKLQSTEVADAKFLPLDEAEQFIKIGRSTLGETTGAHRYYQRLFEMAKLQLVA